MRKIIKILKSISRRDSINLPSQFDSSCRISLTEASASALRSGSLTVKIKRTGNKDVIRDFTLTMKAVRGKFDIKVGGDSSSVVIEEGCHGTWSLRLWRSAKVHIGRGTSCNSADIFCDNSEIKIGDDCMLSDEVVMQCGDQHGVVDLTSGEIKNTERKSIMIGSHVWICRRASLLHGAKVGRGSIVGLGAIVNTEIDECSLAVGVPAKTARRNISWTRHTNKLDEYSSSLISERLPLTHSEE